MISTLSSLLRLALVPAVLLALTGLAHAQTEVQATGGGTLFGPTQALRTFSFHAITTADGEARGELLIGEPSAGSRIRLEITSLEVLGDRIAMAGKITHAVHAPPQFAVGATAFFAVLDDHATRGDGMTGITVVPAFLGHPSIQQILALIGPPPDAAFFSLRAGEVRLH